MKVFQIEKRSKGEKITSKPVVEKEANIKELVEINQLLTNVNNLLEPSTISTDKVELIELPKGSVLTTGSDLLMCPPC